MVGTLQEAYENMLNGTYDFTINGKCSQCGRCCSNLLPLSAKEIKEIRRYAKKHHIKPQNHSVLLAKPSFDMACPFLDESKPKEKCTIYNCRPEICRSFLCSEPEGARKNPNLLRKERTNIDVYETFFGGDESENYITR